MLEIDIVYDNPNDKEPAGVYICHCGEAPHSNSAIEIKRANDKGMKSRRWLPNWSAGAPFTRFSKILKEIDNWLVAHPKEIVFIMPENNSATVAQFDNEVTLAGLRTGTLKRDSRTDWPTKPELIASNKRLIILAADGIDLPADGDGLDHRPGRHDGHAAQKQREIAMAKDGRGFGFTGHGLT